MNTRRFVCKGLKQIKDELEEVIHAGRIVRRGVGAIIQ